LQQTIEQTLNIKTFSLYSFTIIKATEFQSH
jgi:hypothetical protein